MKLGDHSSPSVLSVLFFQLQVTACHGKTVACYNVLLQAVGFDG